MLKKIKASNKISYKITEQKKQVYNSACTANSSQNLQEANTKSPFKIFSKKEQTAMTETFS
jgi:hypothetical protein